MVPPTSGPTIMENTMTLLIMPWYLPRSRGGISSPITAITQTATPPPPSPWTARAAINCPIVSASPLRADPVRKTDMATMSHRLRPYMSPSRPQTGVEAAAASV